MLLLLPAEADVVLEKRCCEKNTIRSLCFDYSKMIFVLLIKVARSYVVITPINLWKTCLEKAFIKAFYSYEFSFYYYPNNIL